MFFRLWKKSGPSFALALVAGVFSILPILNTDCGMAAQAVADHACCSSQAPSPSEPARTPSPCEQGPIHCPMCRVVVVQTVMAAQGPQFQTAPPLRYEPLPVFSAVTSDWRGDIFRPPC